LGDRRYGARYRLLGTTRASAQTKLAETGYAAATGRIPVELHCLERLPRSFLFGTPGSLRAPTRDELLGRRFQGGIT
jgi:hypothetical protein